MLKLDDRPIARIGWWFEPEFNAIEVGRDGITKIDVAEMFCGDSESLFWVQVWKGNNLYMRCNARNIDTIHYEEGLKDA